MIPQSTLRTVLATCSILSIAPQAALAHMEMSWPYAIRSSYNPANNYTDIDYSMTSPLLADGSNFPCKGYQNDRPLDPVITYSAGSTYNMTLAGSATHGGGSCQLSLSYDNGATFRVIQSMIGGCPLQDTYNFTIPSYVPNGDALFAWSWQNLVGNREYYMNCAEVAITGSSAGSVSTRDVSSTADDSEFTSFDDLPFIYKANLEGLNDCVTVESVVPVYPDPGPAIIYGSGASNSSAATSESGECDAAKPFGQTYEYLDDSVNPTTEVLATGTAANTGAAASSSSAGASSMPSTLVTSTTLSSPASGSSSSNGVTVPSSISSSSSSSSAATATSPTTSNALTYSDNGAGRSRVVSTASSMTTCPPDVTVTIYETSPLSTTTHIVSSSVASSLTSSSVVVKVSSSSSASPSASSASGTTSSVGPEETEGYATNSDLATYLPCVPGTFLCTSNTTWVTCDEVAGSNGQAAWVYDDSRVVAAGMECLPYISPYSNSTSQYAQQADTPTGYYRDDRYVRARPDGSCSDDGSIECANNGTTFLVCDQGGWVDMGDVAAGTTCENGAIVASS